MEKIKIKEKLILYNKEDCYLVAEIWDTLQKAQTNPKILQKQKEKIVRLYFDGSVRPSEGKAGEGWLIIFADGEDEEVIEGSKKLNDKTSNQAEWIALLEGLKALKTLNLMEKSKIYIYGDSQLVINQLTGIYRTRASKLIPYAHETKKRLFPYLWATKWIPREFNDKADKLAGLASA